MSRSQLCLLVLSCALALFACGNDLVTSNSGPARAAASASPTPATGESPPAACPNPGDNQARDNTAAPRDPRAPVATNDDGTRVFGRTASLTATTALTDLLGTPRSFDGQTIRTTGVVRQVCQRMGCWMELASEGAQAQRMFVRMAGHAFLLPRDVVGHRAVAEGRVALRPMSANEAAHYRSEGATVPADGMSVEIEATTVEILADAAATTDLPATAQPSG